MIGLLTPRHPYHRDAEVTHFLAWRAGQPAGRISAAVNRRFNEHHGTRVGFFGFWETINDYTIASALLERARDWVRGKGMTALRGPGEYSNATHERQGILIDGFEYPPTVELTHNPPYYGEFLERFGFKKVKDYHAYLLDVRAPAPARLQALRRDVSLRRDIQTRSTSLKDFRNDIKLVVKIYNEAWAHNWGFLPITEGEAELLADSLRPVVDTGLIRFAFVRGELAAVIGAFPDPNYAFRPRWAWYGDSDPVRILRLLMLRGRIPRTRLMFYGVRPGFRRLGIDALLFDEVKEYLIKKGYRTCEASLILEDNHLIVSPAEFLGAQRYKTWRIYELPLT